MVVSAWHCVDGVGGIYGPTSQPDATLDDFKWCVGGRGREPRASSEVREPSLINRDSREAVNQFARQYSAETSRDTVIKTR